MSCAREYSDRGGMTLRSGLQLRTTNLDCTQLLEEAMRAEDEQLLDEDYDDCEGQELTSAPPSRSPSPMPLFSQNSPPSPRCRSPASEAPHTAEAASLSLPMSASLGPLQAPAHTIPPDRRRRNEAAKRRKTKRRVAAATSPYDGKSYRTRSENISKLEAIAKISISLKSESLPAAGPGSYIGRRQMPRKGKLPTPKQLLARGFTEVAWDGVTTHLYGDREGRCIVILAGRPSGDSWSDVINNAGSALRQARVAGLATGAFKKCDLQHRRGAFLAFASGVSYGGGQTKPGNLVQSAKRASIVKSLHTCTAIRRIAGFQSRTFATFAPKIFEYAKTTLKKLFLSNPNLKPNFSNSIYPTITYNCGPDTACLQHVDHSNAAHMLCAVTALGSYNPSKGGHLVLYPLKKFFRFPPGSTILVPSAIIAHGNTPISRGEVRMSVTQYCPGGLLRWVEYGFRSGKTLLDEPGGAARKAQIDGEPGRRCAWALELFSKMDELLCDSVIGAE